jgi:excisionase family DNA binding protein
MDEIDSAPQQKAIEPRLLTLEDVATYLSVSVPQVYALVRSGGLVAVKIGGRGIWRVDRRELDLYVDRLHEEAVARSQATVARREDG